MTHQRRAATLPVEFFRQGAVEVARGLLGRLLVSEVRGVRTAGRIVEVEAYLGEEDPASHAYRLRRHAQNQALYGPPGDWYVYRSYGVHWCANLVCGPVGRGAAVLIRALEPVEGLRAMRRRRGLKADHLLCAGPGRLTQALAITRRMDGAAMRSAQVRVSADLPLDSARILETRRIGISRAVDWPLRFVERDSPWLSRPATP
ncbi:MAG TPA: DNA-3-methyladenine glycosylase [Gemmatimonadales bacterium]|nr:DNA-3-methyladenine glycosylase [Gemmatimonadales bacterium]